MAGPTGIYDHAAFDAFSTELIRAGFSPVADTEQAKWVGPIPNTLSRLTAATEAFVLIPFGWPVVGAKILVPGLIADHVTNSGYICLWADDDPAQSEAVSYSQLLERLAEWAAAAEDGFDLEDQALDSWAFFAQNQPPSAEIDLPSLLANSSNGLKRPLHGRCDLIWTFSRSAAEGHDLQGVLLYRSSAIKPPRSYGELLASLTKAQRDNLDRGVQQRSDTARGKPSGGYDFAILAWPRYGKHDALLVSFEGTGDSFGVAAHRMFPSDLESRLHRAGPDAKHLRNKKVLVAGVGSVGSQLALLLATSGVGVLHLSDDGRLRTVNLVRHAVGPSAVGYLKASGLAVRIDGAAPWCEVKTEDDIPNDPDAARDRVRGFDLVVDCTGTYSATTALSSACQEEKVPLVSVALYSAGNIFRVRCQAPGDLPFYERTEAAGYPSIPTAEGDSFGFLELGCTSPIHNAPPIAVSLAAAEGARASIDLLLQRQVVARDAVTVLVATGEAAPFNQVGRHPLPFEAAE